MLVLLLVCVFIAVTFLARLLTSWKDFLCVFIAVTFLARFIISWMDFLRCFLILLCSWFVYCLYMHIIMWVLKAH